MRVRKGVGNRCGMRGGEKKAEGRVEKETKFRTVGGRRTVEEWTLE